MPKVEAKLAAKRARRCSQKIPREFAIRLYANKEAECLYPSASFLFSCSSDNKMASAPAVGGESN